MFFLALLSKETNNILEFDVRGRNWLLEQRLYASKKVGRSCMLKCAHVYTSYM